MQIWGLHIIDVAIIAIYLGAIGAPWLSSIFGQTVSLPCCSNGVATAGGQTQAKRIPEFIFSWYRTSVKARTANLEAV